VRLGLDRLDEPTGEAIGELANHDPVDVHE
jgi:hypothetical protein